MLMLRAHERAVSLRLASYYNQVGPSRTFGCIATSIRLTLRLAVMTGEYNKREAEQRAAGKPSEGAERMVDSQLAHGYTV